MTDRATDKLNTTKKLLLALAAAGAVSAPLMFGLSGTAVVRAQAPSLKIEVASIKRNNSDQLGGFRPQSGGFNFVGFTVDFMLQLAYGVQRFQVLNGPGWVDSDRFDVVAKLQGATGMVPPNQMLPALQELLADRFHLRFHRETKEGAAYALTIAPGGPRLHVAQGVRPTSASGGGYLSGTMDLATLSTWLTWRLQRPVINATNLRGTYDLELTWMPDNNGEPLGPPPPPPPPAPAGTAGPALPMRTPTAGDSAGASIFTAVEEQLGLKLESRRGPVDVIVIDHVEQPTPD